MHIAFIGDIKIKIKIETPPHFISYYLTHDRPISLKKTLIKGAFY